VDDPAKLGPMATTTLQDPANELVVSAATVWEIAIKVGIRKLKITGPYRVWMNQALSGLGATLMPITIDYADVQAGLPEHHRDPFDRLLVAQALVEAIPIVSVDTALDPYGVRRL
jgi:PIN domain nuclease of toxin-antitoxin system